MPFNKSFAAVFCLLLATAAFSAQGDNSNGVEPRVSALEGRADALEELTVLQQGEIDQNASDIADLQNAGGGGSGGPGWVVMDSGDQDVGTLISVGNSFQAVVELSAGGETFLVTAKRDGIQQFYQPLYYTSAGCTGEEVFTTVDIDELQNIVIFVEPGFADSRVAYHVSDVQTNEDLVSYSVAGGCYSYTSSFDVLPVTPVTGDLHLDYPPPYTLVSQ